METHKQEHVDMCSALTFCGVPNTVQVHKLEMLDGKVKELMDSIERCERDKLQLEDEYSRVRAQLARELGTAISERDAFMEKCEILTSELDATARALQREQAERRVEAEEAERRTHLLETQLSEKEALLASALKEVSVLQAEMEAMRVRTERAEKTMAAERAARIKAEEERDEQARIAHMRYCELQIEACARETAQRERDAYYKEKDAAAEARAVLDEENTALSLRLRELHKMSEARDRDADEVAKLMGRLLASDTAMRAAVRELKHREAVLLQALRKRRCVSLACSV